MSARTVLVALNALTAVWLGLITPLLCVPGLTSDHDHGLHVIFAAPAEVGSLTPGHTHADGHAHHGQRYRVAGRPGHPGKVPAGRPVLTEPWPTSPTHVHASDGGASLPTMVLASFPVQASWHRVGRAIRQSSISLPPPWHPPQSV